MMPSVPVVMNIYGYRYWEVSDIFEFTLLQTLRGKTDIQVKPAERVTPLITGQDKINP